MVAYTLIQNGMKKVDRCPKYKPLVKKSCVEKIFVFIQKDFNPTDQTFMISFLHLNQKSINDLINFELPNTSFGSEKCNTVQIFMMRF